MPPTTGKVEKWVGARSSRTQFSLAVCVLYCRKYEVVELLGRYGADVNVRDNSGSTAFDIASMIGR